MYPSNDKLYLSSDFIVKKNRCSLEGALLFS